VLLFFFKLAVISLGLHQQPLVAAVLISNIVSYISDKILWIRCATKFFVQLLCLLTYSAIISAVDTSHSEKRSFLLKGKRAMLSDHITTDMTLPKNPSWLKDYGVAATLSLDWWSSLLQRDNTIENAIQCIELRLNRSLTFDEVFEVMAFACTYGSWRTHGDLVGIVVDKFPHPLTEVRAEAKLLEWTRVTDKLVASLLAE
jgi:hypothetical protein